MPGPTRSNFSSSLVFCLALGALLHAGSASADIITWSVAVEAGLSDVYVSTGQSVEVEVLVTITKSVQPSASNVGYEAVHASFNGLPLALLSSTAIYEIPFSYGPWNAPLTIGYYYQARLDEPNLSASDSVTIHVTENGSQPLPDPGTSLALLGLGLAGLTVLKRRSR